MVDYQQYSVVYNILARQFALDTGITQLNSFTACIEYALNPILHVYIQLYTGQVEESCGHL